MKSRILRPITALTLFAAMATPPQFAAQEQQEEKKEKEHLRYTVIDLGTLGGTRSLRHKQQFAWGSLLSLSFAFPPPGKRRAEPPWIQGE
jgi:hypothetical protein